MSNSHRGDNIISNTLVEKRLDSEQNEIDLSNLSFTSHSPIIIRGDEAFSNYNFTGTGEEETPYTIEFLNITQAAILIDIQDTTVHFNIENCFLDGLNGNYVVIYLNNVENAFIGNSTILNGFNGLEVLYSREVTVSRNLFYHNTKYGTYLIDSSITNLVELNDFIQNNLQGVYSAYDNTNRTIIRDNFWETDSGWYSFEGNYNFDKHPQISPVNPTFIHYLSRPTVLFPNDRYDNVYGIEYVRWFTAFDSKGHEVYYDVYLSDDAGSTWEQLATELMNTTYIWNSSIYPNGEFYKIKIRAGCAEGLIVEDTSNDNISVGYYGMFGFKSTLFNLFLLLVIIRVKQKSKRSLK